MNASVKNADFLGVLEPLFSFEYNLMIDKLDNDILKLIRRVQLPKLSSQVNVIQYKNYTKTIAGKPVHHELSIDLEAYVNPNTVIKAWKWYRLVNKAQGVVGLPREYKSGGKVIITTGRNEPVVTWELLGLWPSDVTVSEASDNSNEIFKIGMTLQYDDVKGPI